MKKLVSNSPAFDLVCDKRSLSASSVQADKEIEIIAQALSQNYDELKKTFQDTAASEIIVLEDMSHEQLLIFETKIQDIPDCQIKQSTKRDYLYGNIFSQILGYTSRINRDEYGQSKGYAISDTIGKQGLEKYYETYLRGVPGQLKTIRLANGQEKSTEVLLEPTAGYNLILNIDANLQQKAYEALESSIKNLGPKGGGCCT
jgi:penicillin-binding protein 2